MRKLANTDLLCPKKVVQIKNLPGRKTDIKDSEWIAQLLRAGLVPKSFVPLEDIRDLRDLTRYSKKILSEINKEKNRIHKILQDANIKLTSCISDIFGDTGRQILERIMKKDLINRETLIGVILTGRGKGKVKRKIDDILEAVNGKVRDHHIKMIKLAYEHILYLEKMYKTVEEDIEEKIHGSKAEIELLDSIPGINEKGASLILAEIGTDMEQFSDEKHLAAWAGICPGNNESAGKKKNGKIRQGNKHLKSILCECAWAAKNSKGTRLSICYYKWVKKMGEKKAIIALGNLLLRLCYNILKHKTQYIEVGNKYYDDLEKKRERNYIKYLSSKGYDISKVS